MRNGYWLGTSCWDEPPEDLISIVKELDVDIPRLIYIGQNQFVHTFEDESGTYGEDYPLSRIPSFVKDMWEYMKVDGSCTLPFYSRPREKSGLYEGGLEHSEQLPAQCMTIASFVGSILKIRGIPVRYRSGFMPTESDFGPHTVIEYYNDEKWNLVDPKKPDREFIMSWELIQSIDNEDGTFTYQGKKYPLEKIKSPRGWYTGIQEIVRGVTYDILNLANEPISPWMVTTFYRATSTKEPSIIRRFDEMVNELLPILKNPEPEELKRIRKDKIVDYKFS